jgi:transposase
MANLQRRQGIPTKLSVAQFEQFVLPHLISGSRGQAPKLDAHVIFHYILRVLYTGCQWQELAIKMDTQGVAETQYTRISSAFRR